jgi:hypothetical protein
MATCDVSWDKSKKLVNLVQALPGDPSKLPYPDKFNAAVEFVTRKPEGMVLSLLSTGATPWLSQLFTRQI